MDTNENTISYKYPLGEHVIFINLQTGEVDEGDVVAVSMYHDKNNNAVNYTLATERGCVQNVPQTIMFKNRDEILNWAINIQ